MNNFTSERTTDHPACCEKIQRTIAEGPVEEGGTKITLSVEISKSGLPNSLPSNPFLFSRVSETDALSTLRLRKEPKSSTKGTVEGSSKTRKKGQSGTRGDG